MIHVSPHLQVDGAEVPEGHALCCSARGLPDRQRSGALLRQLRWIHEHQLQQQLQIAEVARQASADQPHPGPVLPLLTPAKVNKH